MRIRCSRLSLVTALVAIAPWGLGQAQPKSEGRIVSVLEMYTSQGCSSCPPADKLLGTYTGRDDVLVMSFNVDIWDNLGWKDTLAKRQFTERQRAYARSRGDGQVYTPQAVVNGVGHTTGSDKGNIDQLLKGLNLQKQDVRADMNARADAEGVVVEATFSGAPKGGTAAATLWLVKMTPRVEVPITRGENAGRTVVYHNVVRELRVAATWVADAKSARIPRDALAGCKPVSCAAFLQQGETGGMLGAVWLPADSRL